jgi:hypothetical protein
MLAALAFCLPACGRVHEAEQSLPPETNAASPAMMRQITLHVPGMIDRQGIT